MDSCWYLIFKVVDKGGEYANAEYRELAEQFNVGICATAAYSPWSNGEYTAVAQM